MNEERRAFIPELLAPPFSHSADSEIFTHKLVFWKSNLRTRAEKNPDGESFDSYDETALISLDKSKANTSVNAQFLVPLNEFCKYNTDFIVCIHASPFTP